MAVAKLALTVRLLAAESVTVKFSVFVPALPSVIETSLIESEGGGGGEISIFTTLPGLVWAPK